MSSVILMHPWHSSRIWSTFFWKRSWEQSKPKGSCREMVSSKGTVECHKQAGLLVEDNWTVSMVGIQLGEVVRVHKPVSNFLHSGHLVMISADGLIEVTGIQTQAQLTICLLNVGNGGYPVCGLIYMGDHSQVFHLVKVFLDLWAQGDGAFAGSMYYRMNIRLELDLVFTREPTNSRESIWELLYQFISGPDGLGCCMDCSRPGYCCCCGSRCRTWGFCAGLHDCDDTIHLHDC